MPEIEFSELSRAGATHRLNEDAIGHWDHEDGLVFAVADGLGSAEQASMASRLAIEVVARAFGEPPKNWSVLQRLRRAVQVANATVYQKAVTVPELQHMGTTLTATALVGRTLIAAHVGNCRLWLLRDGKLTQLTKDHTWGGERRHTGANGAGRPRGRYAVPRCLGHELIVSVDLLSMDLRPDDVVVQCTDGIHAALAEADIKELLEAHPPQAACRALVRRARAADDADDASVQIAAVGAVAAPARRPWWRLGL